MSAAALAILDSTFGFEEHVVRLTQHLSRRGARGEPGELVDRACAYLAAYREYLRAREGVNQFLAARAHLARNPQSRPSSEPLRERLGALLREEYERATRRLLDANQAFSQQQHALSQITNGAEGPALKPDAIHAILEARAHDQAATDLHAADPAAPETVENSLEPPEDVDGAADDEVFSPPTTSEFEEDAVCALAGVQPPEKLMEKLFEVDEMRGILNHLSGEVIELGREQKDVISTLQQQSSEAHDRADLMVLDVEDHKQIEGQLRARIADYETLSRALERRYQDEVEAREQAEARIVALESALARPAESG